ncbi:glycosyltransferase [Chitinophaga nivalis]|uniref:Glycosyltransferase n=1 Tax=Chitinophaga nivalis TaxID=2991709 RepID=A0ABT3IW78_9BACT|nr:glycosyltransferase [Chitinophaga nivalis]MCW3462076.1 glycosyltransferase [Chitinophaga nivalis]MCW3488232.1 glycosyltransferase [Chitinophaga nivalis]
MNNELLISCVMAVNKDDGYLEEAVRSILNQTFTAFEFIIVANNCEDVFFNKLSAYKALDPRIKIYRTTIGQLPYNLNYGVDVAQGRYIARMDADDIADVNRFARQIEYMQAHPEIDVLGSNFDRINEDGSIIASNYVFYENHNDIKRNMRLKCCMCHPTVMFKKEAFLKAGGYAYGFTAEDYDLWLRMLDRNYTFHNLTDKLLQYRTHGNSATNNNSNLKRNIAYTTSLLYRRFIETKDVGYLLGLFIASSWGIKLIHLRSKALRFFAKK